MRDATDLAFGMALVLVAALMGVLMGPIALAMAPLMLATGYTLGSIGNERDAKDDERC